MVDSEGKKITGLLVDNVLKTHFEDIDSETVDQTKKRILDMVGNAIGGAMCPGNPELFELINGWGGKTEATVMAYGHKGPVHEVALLNCVFGRSFDRGPLTLLIDGKRFPTHTTETTALVALAVGESKVISGKELITSMVVGDDLAARLHIASDRAQPGQAPFPGTPVTQGTTDIFGAAAITGRILGLTRSQMENAFGLAVTFMGGGGWLARGDAGATPPPGRWLGIKDPFFAGQLAKGGYQENTRVKLVQGLTAQRGINAAQFAKAGWIGVNDPFFNERGGYYPGIAGCKHIERATDQLGKKFHVEQVFKPYPGGKPTHAPTDAALAIVRKHEIDVDDIDEVILHLSPPATAVHYAKPYVVGDYPTMNALWSYYFAVASALVRRSSVDENYTVEKILDPRVQRLVKKVKLGELDSPRGVELEVKMKNGRQFSEYVPVASGEPSNPISRDVLVSKFMEQVEFSRMVDKKNGERLVALIDGLERVDDINRIVELTGRGSP